MDSSAEVIYNSQCSHITNDNKQHCSDLRISINWLQFDTSFNRVFYPLIGSFIFLGTILNLFSVIYFLKIKNRNAQNVFFLTLTIVDIIALHINFTLPILRQSEYIDLHYRTSLFVCRLLGVLTEFFSIYPNLILILIIIERLIYHLRIEQRRSLYSQKQAVLALIMTGLFVIILSSYRFYDLKGIDQISVFALMTCNTTHNSKEFLRNVNLILWTISSTYLLLILLMCLIFIHKYQMKKYYQKYSTLYSIQNKRITKIVLYLGSLSLFLHTPTGIVNTLSLFFNYNNSVWIIIIIILRKFTMIPYGISLYVNTFIYYSIYPDFKTKLKYTICGFHKRTNSYDLGRPLNDYLPDCPTRRSIIFTNRNRFESNSGPLITEVVSQNRRTTSFETRTTTSGDLYVSISEE